MNVLIDTSAWIEYFRATNSAAAKEVRRLLGIAPETVTMCEPIAMEILSGARSEDTHRKLEQLVNGLPSLKLDDAVDFRSAATIYRQARQKGLTIRSVTGCLIAALAIRHDVALVHRDADFEIIASFTPLAARSFR